jgi:hypothetical protein
MNQKTLPVLRQSEVSVAYRLIVYSLRNQIIDVEKEVSILYW